MGLAALYVWFQQHRIQQSGPKMVLHKGVNTTWQSHMQAERMADALVIASVGGSYLFEKAQKEYMRRAPRPYMKIVSAIMSHDLTGGSSLKLSLQSLECAGYVRVRQGRARLDFRSPCEGDVGLGCEHCMRVTALFLSQHRLARMDV